MNKTAWWDEETATRRVWCTDCAARAFEAWRACDCEKTPEEQAQIAAYDKALAELREVLSR